MGYTISILVFCVLVLFSIYDFRKFLSLSGGKQARYPVIGYKRVIFRKFLPVIVPVIQKDNKTYTLEVGNINHIIPMGTNILCHEKDEEIVFKAFTLLLVPIVTLMFALIIGQILLLPQYISYTFLIFTITILAPFLIDQYQIYGRFSLYPMWACFFKPKKKAASKLSDEEYNALIKKDQILSYEDALRIKEKEEFLQLLMLIPFLMLMIISYALGSAM